MNRSVKSAVITSFVSRTKDRFHEYNQPLEFPERLALAATIEGMSGVEVVFPYETKDPVLFRSLLANYRMVIAANNVNVKA